MSEVEVSAYRFNPEHGHEELLDDSSKGGNSNPYDGPWKE